MNLRGNNRNNHQRRIRVNQNDSYEMDGMDMGLQFDANYSGPQHQQQHQLYSQQQRMPQILNQRNAQSGPQAANRRQAYLMNNLNQRNHYGRPSNEGLIRNNYEDPIQSAIRLVHGMPPNGNSPSFSNLHSGNNNNQRFLDNQNPHHPANFISNNERFIDPSYVIIPGNNNINNSNNNPNQSDNYFINAYSNNNRNTRPLYANTHLNNNNINNPSTNYQIIGTQLPDRTTNQPSGSSRRRRRNSNNNNNSGNARNRLYRAFGVPHDNNNNNNNINNINYSNNIDIQGGFGINHDSFDHHYQPQQRVIQRQQQQQQQMQQQQQIEENEYYGGRYSQRQQNAPRNHIQSTTQEYMLSEHSMMIGMNRGAQQSRYGINVSQMLNDEENNMNRQSARGLNNQVTNNNPPADLVGRRQNIIGRQIIGNQNEIDQNADSIRQPEQQQFAITEDNYLLYQRFNYKHSTWQALNFLLMIFEISLLAIGTLLIVYLRGKNTSLNIQINNVPIYSIYIITSAYPFLKIVWIGLLLFKAKRELKNLNRKFEPVMIIQFLRDIITNLFLFVASMLYLGSCFFDSYFGPVGSIILIIAFAQKFLVLKKNKFNVFNCKLNMISVLRGLYNLNILLTAVLILICTFKSQRLLLVDTSWEQILAPLYFFMTELLLVAIISFVVLVNSVIQLCCNQSSRASRLSRQHNDQNSQEMRVSVWFLYVSVCGLLCLFLLLKNASLLQDFQTSNTSSSYQSSSGDSTTTTTTSNTTSSSSTTAVVEYNIITDKGQMVILYFGGIFVLTLIFFASLRQWMANFIVQADESGMQKLFLENLSHPSTQDILRRLNESLEEQRRLESEERRRRQAEIEGESGDGDSEDDGDSSEEEEEDPEEIEQMKAIEKMLDDPELRLDRIPRYFFKISNSYFMSAYKYYHQDIIKGNHHNHQNDLSATKKNNKKNDEIAISPSAIEANIAMEEIEEQERSEQKQQKRNDEDKSGVPGKTPNRVMNTCNDEEFIFKESADYLNGNDTTNQKFLDQHISHSMRTNDLDHQHKLLIEKLSGANSQKSTQSKTKKDLAKKSGSNGGGANAHQQNQDCVICLSQPADSVIVPCGHGGICFQCCQQIINEVVKSATTEEQRTRPYYLIGENGETKIYNFRCHLCRNIGLKVFQLDEQSIIQSPIDEKLFLKNILIPKQGVKTKNKNLTALKHANLLLRRQQLKNQIIKVKQYIDLRKEPPFIPILIKDLPIDNNDELDLMKKNKILTTEEELKESLPNEFGTHSNEELAELAKYAFFDEENDLTNFEVLRQKGDSPDAKTNNNSPPNRIIQKPTGTPSRQHSEKSPRLPSDISIDENNLATAKLSNLNFKRPPSPEMIPATMEPQFHVSNDPSSGLLHDYVTRKKHTRLQPNDLSQQQTIKAGGNNQRNRRKMVGKEPGIQTESNNNNNNNQIFNQHKQQQHQIVQNTVGVPTLPRVQNHRERGDTSFPSVEVEDMASIQMNDNEEGRNEGDSQNSSRAQEVMSSFHLDQVRLSSVLEGTEQEQVSVVQQDGGTGGGVLAIKKEKKQVQWHAVQEDAGGPGPLNTAPRQPARIDTNCKIISNDSFGLTMSPK